MTYCNSSQLMEHIENLDGLMVLAIGVDGREKHYLQPMPPLLCFDDFFAEVTTVALTPL